MNDAVPAEDVTGHPAFGSGLLDYEYHAPLVRDLARTVARAGLGPNYQHMVWTPLSEIATDVEVTFVSKYDRIRENGLAGLCYHGNLTIPPDVVTRMMALTGCFLRNYVDARVATVQEVLAGIKDGSEFDPTVLLIPNFHLPQGGAGNVASWNVSELFGMLLRRHRDGRLTVLYAQSLDRMAVEYGAEVTEFVKQKYVDSKDGGTA
jgi:hypothetical protein